MIATKTIKANGYEPETNGKEEERIQNGDKKPRRCANLNCILNEIEDLIIQTFA